MSFNFFVGFVGDSAAFALSVMANPEAALVPTQAVLASMLRRVIGFMIIFLPPATRADAAGFPRGNLRGSTITSVYPGPPRRPPRFPTPSPGRSRDLRDRRLRRS